MTGVCATRGRLRQLSVKRSCERVHLIEFGRLGTARRGRRAAAPTRRPPAGAVALVADVAAADVELERDEDDGFALDAVFCADALIRVGLSDALVPEDAVVDALPATLRECSPAVRSACSLCAGRR
ncbi:hypothetical protein BURKHO8Y_580050 [Burkholderia sp. 8Y]|nr:hypothetical protein BURKHO8Y_580050 [Burkholderia sp. 8Y]